MGSIVETRFLQIRKRLDNAGYHEAFDINSLPLVERLTLDIFQLKEQLGVELKNSTSSKTILDEVELCAGLFKGENLRLIRENSKLRVLVQQNEEELAEKLLKTRTKLRDLETENNDLKLLIKQFVERVKKLENESLEKSHQLALLEKQHVQANGVTGEADEHSSKQAMQMDCSVPDMCPRCVRIRNCCSVKCEDTKYATTLDYAKVADSRIDALSKQNRYLKNAQLELAELIKSLKSGIQMRETELERLRTDLDLCGYRSTDKGDQDVDDHTIRELQVALKSAQLQLKVLQRRNVQLEKKMQQSVFHPYDGTSLKKNFEDAGSSAITLEDDDFESFLGGLKVTKKMQLLEKQLSRCIKEKIELKQALEKCEKHRTENPVKEIHISSVKPVQSDIVFEDQQMEPDMEGRLPLQNTPTRIIDTRAVRSLHAGDGKHDRIGDSEKRTKGKSEAQLLNQTHLAKKQGNTNQLPRSGGRGMKFDNQQSSSTSMNPSLSLRKTSSTAIWKAKSKENQTRNSSSGAINRSGQKGSFVSLKTSEVQKPSERDYSVPKSRDRSVSNGRASAISSAGKTSSGASKKNVDTYQSRGHSEMKQSKRKEPLSDPRKSSAINSRGQLSEVVPRRSADGHQEDFNYSDETDTDARADERPTEEEAASLRTADHRSYSGSHKHSKSQKLPHHEEDTENKSNERQMGKREFNRSDREIATGSRRQVENRQPLDNKSSNLVKAIGMQNVRFGREHSLAASISDASKDFVHDEGLTMNARETFEKHVNSQVIDSGTHQARKVKMLHGKSKTKLKGSSQALDRISQEEDDLSFEELLSDEDIPVTFAKKGPGKAAKTVAEFPNDDQLHNSTVNKSHEKTPIQKQRSEYRDVLPTSSSENDGHNYVGPQDTRTDEKDRAVIENGFDSTGFGHDKGNLEPSFFNPNPRPMSSVNIEYSKKRLNVHSAYGGGGKSMERNFDDDFAANSQSHGYGKNNGENFNPDAPPSHAYLEDRTNLRDELRNEVSPNLRRETSDIRPELTNDGQSPSEKLDRYSHDTVFQKNPNTQRNTSETIRNMPDSDVQKSRSMGLHNQRDIPPSNTTKHNPQQAAIDTYGAIGHNAITPMHQRAGERADTDLPTASDTHGQNQYFQHENVDNYRERDALSASQASKFSSMLVEPEQPHTSGGVTQVLNIRQIVHQDSDMSDKQRKDLEREVQRLKRVLEEALDHGEQLERANQRLRMLLEQAEADARRKENQLKSTSVGGFASNPAEHQNLVTELRRMKSRETSLESEITTLRTTAKSLDRDKDEMRIELDRKDEQLSRMNAENRQLSERLAFLVQTMKKAELELSKSGESRHDLQREIDAYKRQIDNLRLDLKRRIDERDEAKKDLIRLTQNTSKSEFERRSISVELEKRSKESDELRRQVKVYIDEIRRIEELLAQKDEELRSLMESYDVLSKEKGALESQRLLTKREFSFGHHDSGDEGMGMTTSTSKLLHQQSAIQSYEEEIRDLSDQIAKLEGQLRTSQDREKLLDRELTAARDLCSKLESSVDSLRYDIASAESTKHKLQAENEQLISNFEAIQRQVEGDQEAHKKLEDIIAKLREKDYEVQKDMKSVVLERDNLQSQLNQLQSRTEQLKEESERYRLRCAELQNEVEKTRRLYHQEKLECEAALAELKRVQSHLNSSSTNFLVTSALGSMMSPNYPSATSFIPGEISPVLPPNSPDAAPHETLMLSPEAVP